ncbi:MAG: DUF3301 domain-containing protein [Wenzhouxiangella sp.]|nr:MAG: DUF3301 domain-containing protein [Wenzhouxiangella sp.]
MSTGLEAPFGAMLLLGAACLWWLSAIRARDLARNVAARFCQRQGWQLLDQTVALASMWPVRQNDRLCWRRRYRFDFSEDGGDRRSGELILHGNRPAGISAELASGARLIE